MLLQTVIKLFINFYLQGSATKTEQRFFFLIQRDAWGSVNTAHDAQQWLHANCPRMIDKEQWPPNSP